MQFAGEWTLKNYLMCRSSAVWGTKMRVIQVVEDDTSVPGGTAVMNSLRRESDGFKIRGNGYVSGWF